MCRVTDDISVTKPENATFTVTSAKEGTGICRNYTTFLGTNKKFCSCTCNNFKRYRMLRKQFFAIFKYEKTKFDAVTKLFLNNPYMILDNQHLTKDPTGMPKNCNTLREIDTTNKIPDNLQGSSHEVFELNEDRLPELLLQRSLIKSKKINIRVNLKQLSDLTCTSNDLELVEDLNSKVKEMLNRFTAKICQGDLNELLEASDAVSKKTKRKTEQQNLPPSLEVSLCGTC